MIDMNIKPENHKSMGYSSKIRKKDFRPDSISNTEMLKSSIHQVIKYPEDTWKRNSDTKRNADSKLIKTENDAIINSSNDKSDDLGTQTIIKTKNAIVKSSRAARKAAQTATKTIRTAKTAIKLLANPIVLKLILVVAVIAVVLIAAITAASSVTGIFSSLTFTSKTSDLNDTYIFITELDTKLQQEINNIESASKWSSIDNFHFYTDFEKLKSVDNIKISTDTTKLIAYLTSKYDDFNFKSVKDEIKAIHEQLYKISYRKWSQKVEYYTTYTNVLTGEKIIVKNTKTVEHLDVELSELLFEEWLDVCGNLDTSQKDRYESILTCGGNEMLKCYGSPFTDKDWRHHISSGFGYRIDPVYEKKAFHNGIDIAMPSGTKINSVSDGITKVGYDPDGYGKYVTITYTLNEKSKVSFLYAHLETIYVVDGQHVKRGDVIATVGSTGKSTGSHLHLTYMINDTEYNPEFYLE